jgi:hypothetical protein
MGNQRKPASNFPSTRWTLVNLARDLDPETRRAALEQLLRTYAPALEDYLVFGRWRLSRDKAEEVVQGFLTDKVLDRDLFGKADPAKGQLRSLVLKSLNNYYCDLYRAEDPTVPLLEEDEPRARRESATSADIFDQAWARQVIRESLRVMQDECNAKGRQYTWELFFERIVKPARDGAAPIDYEVLVERFGFVSPEQAANALVTAKRHFRRVLETVVAQYADGEDLESEVRDLRTVLAAGPLAPPNSDESSVLTVPPADTESWGDTSASWQSMFDPQPDRDTLWSEAELTQLLNHQLRQNLSKVLNELGESVPIQPKDSAAAYSDKPPATLDELFRHPAPTLKTLDAVKRWARRAVRDDAGQLPTEISSLIYFAAIAAALVRCRARISKSDDATLRFGFEQQLTRPCANSFLHTLIRQAMTQLPNA